MIIDEPIITDAAKEAAIERLAEALHFRMECLDPTDTPEWEYLTELEKRFYRQCVEWLLLSPADIQAALRK